VCANTLGQALRAKGETIRVAHTQDLKARLNQAQHNLKIINTRYRQIETDFRKLVRVKMDQARLTRYLALVFPDPSDPHDERAAERVFKQLSRAAFLFVNGEGNRLRSVTGTLWAAYNGVAEMIDHDPTKRDGKRAFAGSLVVPPAVAVGVGARLPKPLICAGHIRALARFRRSWCPYRARKGHFHDSRRFG